MATLVTSILFVVPRPDFRIPFFISLPLDSRVDCPLASMVQYYCIASGLSHHTKHSVQFIYITGHLLVPAIINTSFKVLISIILDFLTRCYIGTENPRVSYDSRYFEGGSLLSATWDIYEGVPRYII
jgi:hypothetical protein